MRRVSSEAPCTIDRRTKLQAKWVALLLTSTACTKKTAGKHYELQGRVVAVDSGSRRLTVTTVPFVVARGEDWIFGKIGPGDHTHATLVISDQPSYRTFPSLMAATQRVTARQTCVFRNPGLVFEKRSY